MRNLIKKTLKYVISRTVDLGELAIHCMICLFLKKVAENDLFLVKLQKRKNAIYCMLVCCFLYEKRKRRWK